jgi:DnaJ like chaperone protein
MGDESQGGVWDSVKSVFGGLFGGSGLTPEKAMEVEVLFGLIGFLAKSDGLITSYESEFSDKLLDALGLKSSDRDRAVDAFNAGTRQGFDVEAAVGRFSAQHALGSEQMERVFESLLRLALSDGRVYPRERMALERVATAFGVTKKALDQRLEALKR